LLAEHYAGGRVEVYSAGSEPGDQVHPEVARVLAEAGVSTAAETPKAFDPDATYDVVITMGCGETCPLYAGARYEDWELDDPKGQQLPVVRRILVDIDGRVRALLADLVPDHPLPPSVFDRTAVR
jgi:arsenate reductase